MPVAGENDPTDYYRRYQREMNPEEARQLEESFRRRDTTKPTLALDTTRGSPGSYFRITGSGFDKQGPIRIRWAESTLELEAFADESGQFALLRDRVFQQNQKAPFLWTAIPRSARPGVYGVQAVQDSSGKVSNTVPMEVYVPDPAGLPAALDRILELFRAEVPANPKSSSGWRWNMFSAQGTAFTCGDYQDRTLKFLQSLLFSENPERRQLIAAFDFGPMVSGIATPIGANLTHHFVALWPRGEDWKQSGLYLDPWISQKPRVFPAVAHNGSSWWARSVLFHPVTETSPSEPFFADDRSYFHQPARPDLVSFGAATKVTPSQKYHFPNTTPLAVDDEFRYNDTQHTMAGHDATAATGPRIPPTSVQVRCPVRVWVESPDVPGLTLGHDPGGSESMQNALGFVAFEEGAGADRFYRFGLEQKRSRIRVEAIGSGPVAIEVSHWAHGTTSSLPAFAVRAGESARFDVQSDQATCAPLERSDGQRLAFRSQPLGPAGPAFRRESGAGLAPVSPLPSDPAPEIRPDRPPILRQLSGTDGAQVEEIRFTPAGEILLAGASPRTNRTGKNLFVARLRADGTPDAHFGAGGVQVREFGPYDDCAFDLAAEADGGLVVVARVEVRGHGYDPGWLRFDGQGRLVPSFGTAGRVVTSLGSAAGESMVPRQLVAQEDRRIALCTGTVAGHPTLGLAGVRPDGSLDDRLGPLGTLTWRTDSVHSWSRLLGIDHHDLLIATLEQTAQDSVISVLRVSLKDTRPAPPAVSVSLRARVPGAFAISSMLVDSGGRVLVLGRNPAAPPSVFEVMRFSPQGNLDPTFGQGGRVRLTLGESTCSPVRLLVGRDRGYRVIAQWREAGTVRWGLVRLDEAGAMTGELSSCPVPDGDLRTAQASPATGAVWAVGSGSSGSGTAVMLLELDRN